MSKAGHAQTANGYQVLNFFVPLRRGVRMPDGITFTGVLRPSGGTLTRRPPAIVESDSPLPPLPHPNGAIQIRLIRVDSVHPDLASLDAVYPVAGRALGRPEDATSPIGDSFGTVIKTVAQLNVSSPCKLGSDASTVAAVEESFGWALDCLRELLFRYRQESDSYALIPARETLPAMVMMHQIAYYPDGSVYDDPGGMGAYFPGGQGVEEREKSLLSPEQLRATLSAAWNSYEDPIFQRFNTFSLDAREALYLHGDYRATVLNAATAAECFLDDILSYALWWEGLTPQNAAPILSMPVFKRVKSEFASRFGGVWLPAREGAVLDWHQKVARYRDRVIHGGYQPSQEEAHAALSALSGLRKFVGRRVTSNRVIQRYRHLPLLLLGRDRLRKEGVNFSRMTEWYTDPVDFDRRFHNWRSICRRLRIESFSGSVEPELNKVPVIAAVTKDKIAHYAIDTPVAVAAEIKITRLQPEEREFLEDAQKNLPSTESHASYPFVDMGVKSRIMVSTKWHPAEELLPGYEYMRPASS